MAFAFDADLPQTFELPDAMVNVDNEIPGFQIGEISQKGGGLWPGTRRGGSGVHIEDVGKTVQSQGAVGNDNPIMNRSFQQDDRRRTTRALQGWGQQRMRSNYIEGAKKSQPFVSKPAEPTQSSLF